MKRYAVILGFLMAVGARPVWAAPVLSVNFCPGDSTCPGGVTEASLTFTEDTTTSDTNDYILDIWIKGDSTAPYYVDELSFTTPADNTVPTGYETVPSLISAPSAGTPWTVFFTNISADSGSCTTSDGHSKEVCIQSDPSGGSFGAPLQGQDLHWQLYVDLAAGYVIDANTSVNLRAQFLNRDGSNAGLLSPGGTTVPEPASVTLLGIGIAAAFVGRGRARRT